MARTVELDAKTKEGNAENENDDEDDARKIASRMQSEFMGGEHDIDEGGGIDEEEFGQTALHQLTLEAARSLLRRLFALQSPKSWHMLRSRFSSYQLSLSLSPANPKETKNRIA